MYWWCFLPYIIAAHKVYSDILDENVDLVEISQAFHNHQASHAGDNQVAGLLRLRELLC